MPVPSRLPPTGVVANVKDISQHPAMQTPTPQAPRHPRLSFSQSMRSPWKSTSSTVQNDASASLYIFHMSGYLRGGEGRQPAVGQGCTLKADSTEGELVRDSATMHGAGAILVCRNVQIGLL